MKNYEEEGRRRPENTQTPGDKETRELERHLFDEEMRDDEATTMPEPAGFENGGDNMDMNVIGCQDGKIHVSEIYSPPRVAARAKEHGLRAGTSFDITTRDTDGRPWDFSPHYFNILRYTNFEIPT